MNLFLKRLFNLFCVVGCFVFLSCEIGLGEEVDLEAPVITITSPEKFSYSPLHIVFTGTCEDNKAVTSVVITNKETGYVYGNADIEDNNWTFEITLPKEEEGEITFCCTANDDFGNESTKSSRNITLLVDEHAPECLSWYVERGNNKQESLREKETLETLDYTLSTNKNVPQNQEFYIHGSFYDAMGIDHITLKLWDLEKSTTKPIIDKSLSSVEEKPDFIGEGKSIYTPVFTFTEADLTAKDNSYSTGKHYFKVEYYSVDNDSINKNEDTVDTEKYILWWPESDKPGIQLTSIKDGKISVSKGSQIPVDFFDDDALKEVYYSLRKTITGTPEQYAQTILTNSSERISAFTDKGDDEPAFSETDLYSANSEITDKTCQISAPGFPCQMYLVTLACDKNNKWNSRVVPVEVTDEDKPLLFIESPSQNTIPEIKQGTDSTFQFKGYSLDTKGSECIKIVYIPDSTGYNTAAKKEERAKSLLATYKSDKTAKKVISSTNEVIWYKKFGTGISASGGWNQQSFEIDMDIKTDFKDASGVSTATKDKFFLIYVLDTDGNEIYKSFTIKGDDEPPLITITSPEKELGIHDYTKDDLVLTFKGYKNSGLKIDDTKYKVTTKIGNDTITFNSSSTPKLTVGSDGAASVTISKSTLETWKTKNAQPTFTFYATDTLGNGGKGEATRSVILGDKPKILSILTPGKSGEVTCKANDVIKFNVTFSKQVKVEGTPKLILKYSASDTTPKYASYTGGSGSNKLSFEFKVPSGATSQKLLCEGFDVKSENVFASGISIKATELGEGDVYTSLVNATMFDTVIKLDGVAPTISSVEVSAVGKTAASDTNFYCKVGDSIRATVYFSETISVSSNPEFKLYQGSNEISCTTESIGDNSISFIHKIISTDPQGLVSYKYKTGFTTENGNYIKDDAGNTLALTASTTGNSKIYIDRTAPNAPSSVTPAAGTYNTAKEISVTGTESNATVYYSKDGGVSWIQYDSSNKEELGSGTYELTAYQVDRAGNKSPNSDTQEVTINNNFPEVTNFTLDLADGSYKEGTAVTFTLNFADKIKVNNATDLKLTFTDTYGNNSKTLNVTVPTGNQSDKLQFAYTVSSTDEIKGVKVTQIELASSVQDIYGNKPAFATTAYKITTSNCQNLAAADGGNRTGVNLDGKVPTISTYSPVNNGVCSETDNENFKITLTFSENVAKESGEIILQRKGDWAIPAVLTETEYNNYYLKMTAENQAKLIKTDSSGSPVLGYTSGMPVGPYQKIPQGLKLENGSYVPDKSVKFVLVYDLGLYSGTASLNDGTQNGTFTASVADIRNALKSVDFDKHKVDVSSDFVKITNNVVEITFPDVIEDGREWELYIPNTAFRDDAANFYKGMSITGKTVSGATDTYTLWSNKVAKPVVRLDKYSHGWGAREPGNDGSISKTIANASTIKGTSQGTNTGHTMSPTGYARVRIDCETPDATIKYEKLNTGVQSQGTSKSGTNPGTYTQKSVGTSLTYYRSYIPDITEAAMKFTNSGDDYTQGNNIAVGDGTYTTARKDYVVAKASKTNFTASDYGYEGVFKTVLYIPDTGKTNNPTDVQGGTAQGGQPNIDGFPLRDNTSDQRYSKDAYCFDGNESAAWVTYEIVTNDYAMLVTTSNYSQKYPLNSYGQMCYITKISFY